MLTLPPTDILSDTVNLPAMLTLSPNVPVPDAVRFSTPERSPAIVILSVNSANVPPVNGPSTVRRPLTLTLSPNVAKDAMFKWPPPSIYPVETSRLPVMIASFATLRESWKVTVPFTIKSLSIITEFEKRVGAVVVTGAGCKEI